MFIWYYFRQCKMRKCLCQPQKWVIIYVYMLWGFPCSHVIFVGVKLDPKLQKLIILRKEVWTFEKTNILSCSRVICHYKMAKRECIGHKQKKGTYWMRHYMVIVWTSYTLRCESILMRFLGLQQALCSNEWLKIIHTIDYIFRMRLFLHTESDSVL